MLLEVVTVRVIVGEGVGGLGVTGSGCCDFLGYFWVFIFRIRFVFVV